MTKFKKRIVLNISKPQRSLLKSQVLLQPFILKGSYFKSGKNSETK
jgi:hypothetical protein